MTATVAERVAAGAAFLDQHESGWDEHIDLDVLDIACGCSCVLGQLWRRKHNLSENDWPFEHALSDLGLFDDLQDCADLGFARAPVAGDYAALEAEWRRVIEARRTQS